MNLSVTDVISIPKIPAALASSTVNNLEPTAVAALIEFPPNNPSGIVYSEKELNEFAKILEDYPSTYVLSDEIYEHIIYGEKHFSFANLPNMFDRTITVNGLAKAFSMTGWRIGYIGAPSRSTIHLKSIVINSCVFSICIPSKHFIV